MNNLKDDRDKRNLNILSIKKVKEVSRVRVEIKNNKAHKSKNKRIH